MTEARMSSLLEAQGLTKRYGQTEVVRGVDLSVAPEEVVVLLGPNGCGKTTTIEMALGLRGKDGGSSHIFGLDPTIDQRKIAPRLGFQLQGAQLHGRVTLGEHFRYLAALTGRAERVWSAVDALGLADQLKVQYAALSGGQQRRALVAVALSSDPELVVLDEPTSGVDPESRSLFWSVIRSQVARSGLGVLTTTHDLTEAARHATRIVIMRAGRIVGNGSAQSLIDDLPFTAVRTLRGSSVIEQFDRGQAYGVVLERLDDELRLGCTVTEAAQIDAEAEAVGMQEAIECRAPSVEDAYLFTLEMKGNHDV